MPRCTGQCLTRAQARSDPTGVKDCPDLGVQDFRCIVARAPDAGMVPGRTLRGRAVGQVRIARARRSFRPEDPDPVRQADGRAGG